MKTIILTMMAVTIIGCGKKYGDDVVTNNYFYTDYNVTEINVLCDQMNDGDVYNLEDEIGSSLVKNNGDCYLRFDRIQE